MAIEVIGCWASGTATSTHAATATAAACGGLTTFDFRVERNRFVILGNCQRHLIGSHHALGKALALGFVQAPCAGKAGLLGAGGHDQKHESRRQSGDQKHFSHKKSSV